MNSWVWWEKSGGGFAVGPRDEGMVAWVQTVEEAQRICSAIAHWKPVSADYIGRGVAWIDCDATHICKIDEHGHKYLMQLPMIEERDK